MEPKSTNGERPLESELQQIIIEATKDVFDTMIMMALSPDPPLVEKVHPFCCNVSGMLGFSGDLKGMLTIHCPEEVAKEITSSFLGMEVSTIDDDVKDAIGELANMLMGGVKQALAVKAKDIKLSIPTVIAGRSYNINCLSDANWVIIPFTVSQGKFMVELKFKSNS